MKKHTNVCYITHNGRLCFGGVAIQGNDLGLAFSESKNRFVKIMAKVDEIGTENAFDKLTLIYWLKDDAAVNYGSVKPNTLSALHGSEGYITITFDLGWTNTEEKIIDKFRMDMFTSSMSNAASSGDGWNCGIMWIKYIAFFDTKEEADSYEMALPTEVPATPTPEATVKPTPEKTVNVTVTPIKNDNKVNYTPIFLIAGVFVLAIIAVVLIIFIPKARKKDE